MTGAFVAKDLNRERYKMWQEVGETTNVLRSEPGFVVLAKRNIGDYQFFKGSQACEEGLNHRPSIAESHLLSRFLPSKLAQPAQSPTASLEAQIVAHNLRIDIAPKIFPVGTEGRDGDLVIVLKELSNEHEVLVRKVEEAVHHTILVEEASTNELRSTV
nr:uncharacterized protein CI109_002940 [Kwoniella shandongensis]KAA5528780.1 hypothetical protein CI109_002940 [Kwoniella shandongensis]